MYRLPLCAERVPPTWLALGLDQGPSSLLPRGTSFGRSVQPRPPFFRRGRRSDLSARGGFLPSRKCLSASSSPTPSNGYTFTLFRRHPCRHGRPSIRLQTIHMHYCERLVPFPAHDNSSSIQHLGDEGRAEPRELQLRSPCSFQRYVVDPYQLSRLVLSGPYRRSRVSGATLPVATPPSRAGTPPAILLGVRPRTRSLCWLPLPVPGVLHT